MEAEKGWQIGVPPWKNFCHILQRLLAEGGYRTSVGERFPHILDNHAFDTITESFFNIKHLSMHKYYIHKITNLCLIEQFMLPFRLSAASHDRDWDSNTERIYFSTHGHQR